MSRYDFVVFGAYGFTAKTVLAEICLSNTWKRTTTWAIAGRNEKQLKEVRQILAVSPGQLSLPDILIGDVDDYSSLVSIALQTTLILNCVGPYRLLGEPVIKACLAGKCDYLDLCGEPEFIERMFLSYHELAKRANITICHAAAFDSVPCDLGVLEAKRVLQANGIVPSTVEMFLTLRTTKRLGIHYTTYESAIHGFGEPHHSRVGRKRELAKRMYPKRSPTGPILPRKAAISTDPRVSGWLIPYVFSDPAVVRLSQAIDKESPPIHFAAYVTVPSLYLLLILTLYYAIFLFLVRFRWGRQLLLNYPELFTAGVVTRHGPSSQQIEATSFTQTYFASGYSATALSQLSRDRETLPDAFMAARITGPEPGYAATPILFIKCARTLLFERAKVMPGVLTPAAAFVHCDILTELSKDERIVWALQHL